MFNPTPSYSYDDIGLKPIYWSHIMSRDNVNPSTRFLGLDLKLPILSAPMATATGERLAYSLRELGGLAFLPRTEDIAADLQAFRRCFPVWGDFPAELAVNTVVVSIPATGDYLERAKAFLDMGAQYFCIDVANGFHKVVGEAVENLRMLFCQVNMPCYIITGNVGSLEGYNYLTDLGVDAVRVGISNGSVCSTALATKIGVGQASLIRDIADHRADCKSKHGHPAIIADGGIKNPGDVALAIALGADVVMSGSLFAGTEESPGEVINYGGQLYKHYAGQASRYIKGNPKYIEGADTLVSYKGPLINVWNTYENGLRSAMSYMGAETIDDLKYQDDEVFVYLHTGARAERNVYAK